MSAMFFVAIYAFALTACGNLRAQTSLAKGVSASLGSRVIDLSLLNGALSAAAAALLLCSCFYCSFVLGLCKRCLCLFHLVLHVCLGLRKGLNTSSQLRYIYITLSVVSQSTERCNPPL